MSPTHPGDLLLRRFRIGELGQAQRAEVESHTSQCPECQGALAQLGAEETEFKANLSYARFAEGAQRAMTRARPMRFRLWMTPAMGAVATVFLVWIAVGPLTTRSNRVKGGAAIELRIASSEAEPQRVASATDPEPLRPGDRVRLGYRAGGHAYILALSIDETGAVTALYPEAGESVQTVAGSATTEYLPDSIEFTGQGLEKVLFVLSDEPLSVEHVRAEASRQFQAAGRDLRQMRSLDIPGEQFERLLVKP